MLRVDQQRANEQHMLYLPRTMDNWPWKRAMNSHYEEVSAQSTAWIRTFKAFSAKSQYAFEKCDFGRLAALAYSNASKEHLRTGCDLMNLFFVIDEYTDVEPAPIVREMVDVIIDALHNPQKPRPAGEIILGKATKEFWELAIKGASPPSQKHFLESFVDYLNSVVIQAQDRDNMNIRTIEEYLSTRRENIGARPSYVIGEMHLNLPDEVFYHPAVKELEYLIADILVIDNDIVSYNKEQAIGDDRHNIVTIATSQFGLDIDGAMNWAADLHEQTEKKFLEKMEDLPSWGPQPDKELAEYVQHLANWPRSNDCWSFESGRYFGSKGVEIQRTRYVPLLRKVAQHNVELKRDQVVIPLVDL